MSNRWIRFLLAVLAILVASAAAYRVVQDERRLAADITSLRNADFAAITALTTVEDLKASLHAYVAAGQGLPFWATRAGVLLDKLRGTLLAIDTAATAAGGTTGETLDGIDRLAAAEQRARDHVANGQSLLAGDIIFSEARDLLDSTKIHIARARDQISAAASARHTQLRSEQVTLIAVAIGVLALVMLLLVPVGQSARSASASYNAPAPLVAPRLAPPVPVARTAPAPRTTPAASASARSESPASSGETSPKRPEALSREGGPVSLALAAICTDMAAVGESTELEPILQRVRDLLSARGVIVWLRSPDRTELHAAAAFGYDARVVARLGPIHRETGNLTAKAYRENMARTSAAAGTTAAALAVPLPSPDGPAGVFSAELTPGTTVDESKLAAARVVAAQLGALLGSIPAEQPQARARPV